MRCVTDAATVDAGIRDLVSRAYSYKRLERLTPYPEAPSLGLARRVPRRLTPTERGLYALHRAAVRAKGAGVYLSNRQAARLLECSERSVTRAREGLGCHRDDCAPDCTRHLSLIRAIPYFAPVPWTEVPPPDGPHDTRSNEERSRRHILLQRPTVSVLGPAARPPRRARPPWWARHGRRPLEGVDKKSIPSDRPVFTQVGNGAAPPTPGSELTQNAGPAGKVAPPPAAPVDRPEPATRRLAHDARRQAAADGRHPPADLELGEDLRRKWLDDVCPELATELGLVDEPPPRGGGTGGAS